MRSRGHRIRKVAALAFAAALTAAAPASPSSAALMLAETLIDPVPTAAALDEITGTIARNLMRSQAAWRGPPCDPAVRACREAAERLAREEAPRVFANRRTVRVQMQAVVIDDAMTPAQIAGATTFARTPAGKSLGHAIARDSAELSPAARAKLGSILMRPAAPDPRRSLIDRFYDATTILPRGKALLVPPPPMPSRPVPPARPQ